MEISFSIRQNEKWWNFLNKTCFYLTIYFTKFEQRNALIDQYASGSPALLAFRWLNNIIILSIVWKQIHLFKNGIQSSGKCDRIIINQSAILFLGSRKSICIFSAFIYEEIPKILCHFDSIFGMGIVYASPFVQILFRMKLDSIKWITATNIKNTIK